MTPRADESMYSGLEKDKGISTPEITKQCLESFGAESVLKARRHTGEKQTHTHIVFRPLLKTKTQTRQRCRPQQRLFSLVTISS